MNHCDHDHPTRCEVRRLPISPNGGAVLVCKLHYAMEMAYRSSRSMTTGVDKWDFPKWEDLAVDQEGEIA